MFVQAIYLVATFFIPGIVLRRVFSPKHQTTKSGRFVETWLLGTFTYYIPMIIAGIFYDGLIDQVVFIYFTISSMFLLLFLIFIIANIGRYEELYSRLNIEQRIKRLEIFRKSTSVYDFQLLLQVIIYGIFACMIGLNFILPPRGWDALHFYFPHSFFYYLTDDISDQVNYFNFLPAFKPPTNTLYLTYNWYLTNQFDGQLFPIVFIAGITMIVMEFGRELGHSDRYNFLTVLVLLTTPAFFFTFREYVYYQEFPLTFYYSATMLFFYKAKLRFEQSSTRFDQDWKTGIYFITLSALSSGLAMLSKISGYTILLLVLIVYQITGKRWEVVPKIIMILGFTLFLVYKGLTTIFIGTVVVVGLLGIYLAYHLWILTKNRSPNVLPYMVVFLIGTAAGVMWLIQISRYGQASTFLVNLYFTGVGDSLILTPFAFFDKSIIYIENAHASSWFMTIFVLFFSTQFNGFLGIIRFVGIYNILHKFRKGRNDEEMFITWTVAFFMMWLTYHGTVSTRYLSVVWIPLAFITTSGLLKSYDVFVYPLMKSNLIEYIIEDENYLILPKPLITTLLFPIATGPLLYWPFIPVHTVTSDMGTRLSTYHSNLILTGLYIVGFNILFYVVARLLVKPSEIKTTEKMRITHLQPSIRKRIISNFFIFLWLVGIIGGYGVEYLFFAYSGFDRDAYAGTFTYENRENVQNLFDQVQELNLPNSQVTISVNLPGYEYFLSRPIIDLMIVRQLENLSRSFIDVLHSSDEERVVREFENNNIKIFILLNTEHLFYKAYETSYEKSYPFLTFIHKYSEFIYSNPEFILYILRT